MLLLDTNVISEVKKLQFGRTDARFALWAGSANPDNFLYSVMSLYELRLGLLRLERRDQTQAASLRLWLEGTFLVSARGRILVVDAMIVAVCAELQVVRTLPFADSLLAATALVHDVTLVTRNVRDFAGTGVRVLNPWLEPDS